MLGIVSTAEPLGQPVERGFRLPRQVGVTPAAGIVCAALTVQHLDDAGDLTAIVLRRASARRRRWPRRPPTAPRGRRGRARPKAAVARPGRASAAAAGHSSYFARAAFEIDRRSCSIY